MKKNDDQLGQANRADERQNACVRHWFIPSLLVSGYHASGPARNYGDALTTTLPCRGRLLLLTRRPALWFHTSASECLRFGRVFEV